MKEQKTVRSPYPVYLIAVVWLVMTFIVGLDSFFSYALAVLFSVLVLMVGRSIWPDQVVEVQKPEPEPSDPELAALKRERDESIARIRELNDAIPDPAISEKVSHIELISAKIYQFVLDRPEKKEQIRQFQSYYLPTTIKLLEHYVRLSEAGVAGENITAAKQKIEALLSTVSTAFDRQLDALYGDTAMDIAAEVKVMDTVLQQQGLAGERPF